MNNNLSRQLKAAFLLTVFCLNIVVGFTCAIAVVMGFNTSHHHNNEVLKNHVPADGKNYEHKTKGQSHEQTAHSHVTKHSDKEDHCCNDSVVKLSQNEKSISQVNIIISPVFFTAFAAVYYNFNVINSSHIKGSIKYFVRSYHPRVPDIRIAIQSFQI